MSHSFLVLPSERVSIRFVKACRGAVGVDHDEAGEDSCNYPPFFVNNLGLVTPAFQELFGRDSGEVPL